ncbi:helix-turn-helix domain-containing protein, partial [Candidatus Parcubacteria bacterium]
MTTEIQYFNSQEAAKILGVNVSTIKRWTEEGKLECIKTPGGHRKFLSEHLTKFMELHKRKKARASILPIEGGEDIRLTAKIFSEDLEDLRDAIFEKALVGAIERVLFVLSGFIALPKPLHEIYDHLITPVLYRLGDLWESEEITIVEEHLVSQTLRLALDRLQGLLAIPREKIGTALCLNFSN